MWLAGALEVPFGRGIHLERKTTEVDELYARVQRFGITIFLPIEERWYRVNDLAVGQRQLLLADF